MKSITIKNPEHTLDMQRLTFGAGSFKDYSKKEDYFKLLDCYYDEFGGRSFDTARAYFIWEKGGEGVSERVLGEWIKSRGIKRDEIVVTTKGGFPYLEDYHRHRLDRKTLYTDIEESLETLSLDYVDCYLLHRDTPKLQAGEMLETLNEFYSKGYIRLLGVSNWTGIRIDEANEYAKKKNLIPLSISQICFSLAKTTPDLMKDDTIVCMNDSEYKWYEENDFPVMAFSSQAKGLYPKLLSGKTLSGKCLERYGTEENIKKAERVSKIAEKKGISPAAVSALYVSSNPINSIAVFSPSSVEQLRDTMGALNCELTEKEIKYLDGD
ncbi:MAG: aldo/keto reductase [Ruminococcaceae bacterium]|nr:aldo/keto reductase [Oscillospiraceae bacterium]